LNMTKPLKLLKISGAFSFSGFGLGQILGKNTPLYAATGRSAPFERQEKSPVNR
jgi:hypothetical protein